MEENKNKNISKYIKITVLIVISLFVIFLLIFKTNQLISWNLKENEEGFYKIDIISLIDTIIHFFELLVTIVIGYYLMYSFTKKDNKIIKQKEIVEKLITKTQNYIYEDCITNIKKETILNNELILNMQIRKISNHIKYLKKFSDDFDYSDLIDDADKNFFKFKENISKMREDKEFNCKSFNNLTRLINLVDNKLEEILVRIYE